MDTLRPSYKNAPIQSIKSLALALGKSEQSLLSVSERAPSLYIGPIQKQKKDGTIREVWDTKKPLKQLLQKINRVIFERTIFPDYLTGSLKKRDYITHISKHIRSECVVAEDISKFYDSITWTQVKEVWTGLFHFADDVAVILANLTTRTGFVSQGTPTGSYLANLILWKTEPKLVRKLNERGYRYSRYIDDVTVSSTRKIDNEQKQWIIAQVFAMFGKSQFKAKRKKHEILSPNKPMKIMGMNLNSTVPTLPKTERSKIRTAIFQIEKTGFVSNAQRASASGRLGRLQKHHPVEAKALTLRLRAVPIIDIVLPAGT